MAESSEQRMAGAKNNNKHKQQYISAIAGRKAGNAAVTAAAW
jgi:hypothetical protein